MHVEFPEQWMWSWRTLSYHKKHKVNLMKMTSFNSLLMVRFVRKYTTFLQVLFSIFYQCSFWTFMPIPNFIKNNNTILVFYQKAKLCLIYECRHIKSEPDSKNPKIWTCVCKDLDASACVLLALLNICVLIFGIS